MQENGKAHEAVTTVTAVTTPRFEILTQIINTLLD
jgi:hypothetical protein